MTKKSHDLKKTTSGIGHKPVRGIIVLFTLDSLKKICRHNQMTIFCYGKDVALTDTMAMEKILAALAEGKDTVTI